MKRLSGRGGKITSPKKKSARSIQELKSLGKKWLQPLAHFPSVQEIQKGIGIELRDAMFIHKSAKNDTRWHCYRWDFVFKNKDEVQRVSPNIVEKSEDAVLFVYNEKSRDLGAFEKWDCLLYEQGYCISHGKYNVYYDNAGKELWRDVPLDKSEMN